MDDQPQVHFRQPSTRTTSLTLPSPPRLSSTSTAASLHVPFIDRSNPDGLDATATGSFASSSKAGLPRLGGLGFVDASKDPSLPPLQLSTTNRSSSSSATRLEGGEAKAGGGGSVSPSHCPCPAPEEVSRMRSPPSDRVLDAEVDRVLRRVPVDDPVLVRAMLADVLIKAQRGELPDSATTLPKFADVVKPRRGVLPLFRQNLDLITKLPLTSSIDSASPTSSSIDDNEVSSSLSSTASDEDTNACDTRPAFSTLMNQLQTQSSPQLEDDKTFTSTSGTSTPQTIESSLLNNMPLAKHLLPEGLDSNEGHLAEMLSATFETRRHSRTESIWSVDSFATATMDMSGEDDDDSSAFDEVMNAPIVMDGSTQVLANTSQDNAGDQSLVTPNVQKPGVVVSTPSDPVDHQSLGEEKSLSGKESSADFVTVESLVIPPPPFPRPYSERLFASRSSMASETSLATGSDWRASGSRSRLSLSSRLGQAGSGSSVDSIKGSKRHSLHAVGFADLKAALNSSNHSSPVSLYSISGKRVGEAGVVKSPLQRLREQEEERKLSSCAQILPDTLERDQAETTIEIVTTSSSVPVPSSKRSSPDVLPSVTLQNDALYKEPTTLFQGSQPPPRHRWNFGQAVGFAGDLAGGLVKATSSALAWRPPTSSSPYQSGDLRASRSRTSLDSLLPNSSSPYLGGKVTNNSNPHLPGSFQDYDPPSRSPTPSSLSRMSTRSCSTPPSFEELMERWGESMPEGLDKEEFILQVVKAMKEAKEEKQKSVEVENAVCEAARKEEFERKIRKRNGSGRRMKRVGSGQEIESEGYLNLGEKSIRGEPKLPSKVDTSKRSASKTHFPSTRPYHTVGTQSILKGRAPLPPGLVAPSASSVTRSQSAPTNIAGSSSAKPALPVGNLGWVENGQMKLVPSSRRLSGFEINNDARSKIIDSSSLSKTSMSTPPMLRFNKTPESPTGTSGSNSVLSKSYSNGTLTSMSKRRKSGFRTFFGASGSGNQLIDTIDDSKPSIVKRNSTLSVVTPTLASRQPPSSSGSLSEPNSSKSVPGQKHQPRSVVGSLLGNVLSFSSTPTVSTCQQIESQIGDMTYVNYGSGTMTKQQRSRALSTSQYCTTSSSDVRRRSTSLGVTNNNDDESVLTTMRSQELGGRKSSLRARSKYERSHSFNDLPLISEREEGQKIYGVRFANAMRGLGLRQVAEDEAQLQGGDRHALRWIGVGRGRYGELELTIENDDVYAGQVGDIKAKWRKFGRNLGTTKWENIQVD